MRRKAPTGRFAPVSDAVRLIVDYESADDFLADYADNLSRLEGLVQTERVVPPGTRILLGLEFAGLREPIVLDAIVQPPTDDEGWTRVQLLPSAELRLDALVERIRSRDPRVVTPVVRVLLAEDNPHVCELVKTGLAAATRRELHDVAFGFDIALDGGAALSLLEHATFDAAIVDVYLPVLDGAAVIRHIRTKSHRLPIIAISGGGEAARNAAMRAGASTYLDKPIRLRTIVDSLRQLITV